MKETIRAKTVRQGTMFVPCSILFRDRMYPVSEILRCSFYQGETVFTVRIGKNVTQIYRDEFSNRWYVNRKEKPS